MNGFFSKVKKIDYFFCFPVQVETWELAKIPVSDWELPTGANAAMEETGCLSLNLNLKCSEGDDVEEPV
jgi:hypothetical protein